MIMQETLKDILMRHSRRPPHVMIAGLGNVLLKDDGVGVHAVRSLRKTPSPGVLAVEVGTAIFDALHLFTWADRVLAIDAMQAGGPPGTIYACRANDIEEGGRKTSLHEMSVFAALQFLPHRDSNLNIWVLGVEPETIDYGLELSPRLQSALPQLLQIATRIASSWRLSPEESLKASSFPPNLLMAS
jgi:hydrogenase maturation protease